MNKTLRFDFYKVQTEGDFAATLRAIWALPDDGARNYPFNDGVVRLRELSESNGLITGDVMRIRLHEPAFLAKVGGGEKPISQDDDEGLGETNAFLYCPTKRYLVYQRNRHGVAAFKAGHYFENKLPRQSEVMLEPVLKPILIRQLISARAPKKLHVKLASGGLHRESVQNASLEQIVTAARSLESSQMEVTFSMGRSRRGGMNKNGVVEIVRNLLRLQQDGHVVQALEVTAPDAATGKSEILDFVDATLQVVLTVESSPLVGEFYRRRSACIVTAWETHRNELD